jgi:hypothetical protein
MDPAPDAIYQGKPAHSYHLSPIAAVECALPPPQAAVTELVTRKLESRPGKPTGTRGGAHLPAGQIEEVKEAAMPIMKGKSGETRAKVAELHAQGLTDSEIADRLQIAASSASYHRRALALAPNPREYGRWAQPGRRLAGPAAKPRATHAAKPASLTRKHAAVLSAGKDSGVVTLSLTEDALVKWFAGLPIEAKGRIFAAEFDPSL